MIKKDDIKIVHVEASGKCNSFCPMCSRYTKLGYVQPGLKESDLTPELFYKLFTKEFTSQLEHVYFSGVYGDPCINKRLPEFVNYLIDNGCKSVSIDTNGGYRKPDWWAKLARKNVMVNFAIDGASNETHGLYRIGVVYDTVIENLKALITAGGTAQWNFIVFQHNEHEVETARQLAQDIGAKFRIKVTQKFRSNKNFKVVKEGKELHQLLPPVNPAYRHNNIGTVDHVPESKFTFNLDRVAKHLNGTEVNCKSLERKEVYLTATGLLMPCCYLGTYTADSIGSYQLNNVYDIDQFSIVNNTVDLVLERLYQISNKWTKTIEEGNLITCMHTCSKSTVNTTQYYTNKLNKQTIRRLDNERQ